MKTRLYLRLPPDLATLERVVQTLRRRRIDARFAYIRHLESSITAVIDVAQAQGERAHRFVANVHGVRAARTTVEHGRESRSTHAQ